MPGRDHRLSSDVASSYKPPNGKKCQRPTCKRKGMLLPPTDFQKNRTKHDGLDGYCKTCRNEWDRSQTAKLTQQHVQQRKAKGEAIHRGKGAPAARDMDVLTRKLFEITRKGPVAFALLCDKLDLSPANTKKAIAFARDQGIDMKIEHDHVGLQPTRDESRVHQTGIAPTVGETQRVGVISDLHLGSKYCLRAQLIDFIEYAYSKGIRDILCPGDVLDGSYRHGKWELSHHGLEDQVTDLLETLPNKPGLRYHAITGNHDETFWNDNGVNVGRYIEGRFKTAGRNDIAFYGDRGAFLKIRGAIVDLWHPRSGVSYARSYALQKKIEKYASGEKPHIMLAGHWHVYCHVFERGVHAMACPTFQGGGSAFGKSLGGAPAIGGMILSWDLTEHGTMRNFAHEYRMYFEIEKPQQVEDDTAFLEEIPVRKSRK